MRQRRKSLLRRQCNTTLSLSYCLPLWGTASGGQFDWGGTPLTKEADSERSLKVERKTDSQRLSIENLPSVEIRCQSVEIRGAQRSPHSGQKSEEERKSKRRSDRTFDNKAS